VKRSRFYLVLPVVVWAGCTSLPDTFPPPAQRQPLTVPPSTPFGYFVAMSDPNAEAYIVQGFADASEGSWRWAHDHPVLRFYVPEVPRVNFTMDFSLPEQTFRETGPVTLTFTLNGKLFDRVRYEHAGQQHYSRAVPPEFLHKNGVNLVAIDPDHVFIAKADGAKLGFILSRAGFAE
jgi:hypothetical protein